MRRSSGASGTTWEQHTSGGRWWRPGQSQQTEERAAFWRARRAQDLWCNWRLMPLQRCWHLQACPTGVVCSGCSPDSSPATVVSRPQRRRGSTEVWLCSRLSNSRSQAAAQAGCTWLLAFAGASGRLQARVQAVKPRRAALWYRRKPVHWMRTSKLHADLMS